MNTSAALARRHAIVTRAGAPSSARRSELVDATDVWIAELADAAGIHHIGGALVAVGGYGRRELAPGSDLDLVLLHPNSSSPAEVATVADAIWYPIWDSGISLDHSVRTLPEARKLAAGDVKVVFGLLDARLIFGDPALADQVKSAVLGDWRALAKTRLPEVREAVLERTARSHELAHLLEPDLKESYGGLRDVVLLRAIAASWVTDYPHATVLAATEALLDVRDALHRVTGTASDRLFMQEQAAVAELLGLPSDDALLRMVIDAGRAIAYASDLTWHRVQRLARKQPSLRRLLKTADDERIPLADGVVAQHGEVVLARDADPTRDPVLLLRAAAAAAQAGLRIAPETVDRFAAAQPALPQPWPRSAREAFVSLLGAGQSAIPVWEALDNAGLLSGMLPQWESVRSLPQRNALHIYTVDRHQVETAAHAAAFTRDVHRPDLLLVAALFHDIGKGKGPDHCSTGASLMAAIAPAIGFSDADGVVLEELVRHHLLLAESATRRDLEDPATVQLVVDAVRSHETLDLLYALTKADSLATGPGVWNDWKARLIADLVQRAHAVLAGDEHVEPTSLSERHPQLVRGSDVEVLINTDGDGVRIVVAAPDRVGLLATIAGVLTLQRLEVRAAQLETIGDRAMQSWLTVPAFGDAPAPELLAAEIRRAVSGVLDVDAIVGARSPQRARRRGFVPPPPRVAFIRNASERADVLEVRVHDQPALLWRVGRVIAQQGCTVRSARVSTLGSEVVDVLYVMTAAGDRLSTDEQQTLVETVSAALQD